MLCTDRVGLRKVCRSLLWVWLGLCRYKVVHYKLWCTSIELRVCGSVWLDRCRVSIYKFPIFFGKREQSDRFCYRFAERFMWSKYWSLIGCRIEARITLSVLWFIYSWEVVCGRGLCLRSELFRRLRWLRPINLLQRKFIDLWSYSDPFSYLKVNFNTFYIICVLLI